MLLLDVVDALDHAEVFPSAVFLYNKQTSGIHVAGVNIHNEVLQSLQFVLTIIVIAEQFLHQLRLCLLQRYIVWITAEDVLELTLELVDIVVGLASELKFYLLVSCLSSLLLLCPLVEVLPQAINDAVVVMSVLLPKLP